MSVVLVDTRSWCRAYAIPNPTQPSAPRTQPIPDVGAAWAEAYLPAPTVWAVTVISSLPASNLTFAVEVAGIEGGWQTIPGLVAPPIFLGAVPGRAVRVMRTGGSATPGELVSVGVAPVSWPWWCMPERVPSVPGFYRWG